MKSRRIFSRPGLLTATLLSFVGPVFAADLPALKAAYQDDFLVGVAINRAIATDAPIQRPGFDRTAGQVKTDIALVTAQFNQISPENDLKWASVHPKEGAGGYHFGPADAYVKFGLDHRMVIVGHTLVWHRQTPAWVFAAPGGNTPEEASGHHEFDPAQPHASREELLERMRGHIHTVVGRSVVTRARSRSGTW
jgi:endo-1,4-beta-xylanase